MTAIGRSVSARAAASSRSIASAPPTAIVPSPPASETAAASSWRLMPPPIPAWTTGVVDAEALENRHRRDLRQPMMARAMMPAERLPLVVLASGSGTNLQAILDRLHGREGIEVVGVGSDKPGAQGAGAGGGGGGRDRASSRAAEHADREARDAAMGDWIESRGADLVVLAGYMQLLSPGFVARFRHRVVNVHPALLPAFPGPRRDRPGARGGGRDDRGDGPLRRRGRRHRAADPPARGRRCPPSRDRARARGGGPRARARALPGGDPHDRPGAG